MKSLFTSNGYFLIAVGAVDEIPIWAWIIAFLIKLLITIIPTLFFGFLLMLGSWYFLIKPYVQSSDVKVYDVEGVNGGIRVGLYSGTILWISFYEMRLEQFPSTFKKMTFRIRFCEDLLWLSATLFKLKWMPFRYFFIGLLYEFIRSRQK